MSILALAGLGAYSVGSWTWRAAPGSWPVLSPGPGLATSTATHDPDNWRLTHSWSRQLILDLFLTQKIDVGSTDPDNWCWIYSYLRQLMFDLLLFHTVISIILSDSYIYYLKVTATRDWKSEKKYGKYGVTNKLSDQWTYGAIKKQWSDQWTYELTNEHMKWPMNIWSDQWTNIWSDQWTYEVTNKPVVWYLIFNEFIVNETGLKPPDSYTVYFCNTVQSIVARAFIRECGASV